MCSQDAISVRFPPGLNVSITIRAYMESGPFYGFLTLLLPYNRRLLVYELLCFWRKHSNCSSFSRQMMHAIVQAAKTMGRIMHPSSQRIRVLCAWPRIEIVHSQQAI